MDNNTVYEWILHSTFTTAARQNSLDSSKPYLAPLVRQGDEILDLCCGTGFVSFWFEGLGAKVTGMDFAHYMILLAKQEADLRNSTVAFMEADIFAEPFGQESFDLVSCFDSISDFPVSDFARLGVKVARALKPGGRFALKYMDGCHKYIRGTVVREGVYQEAPERISYHIKEYLPEIGANVVTIRNEARGEEYERKGYIYTPPMVELALRNTLELEQRARLSDAEYLDIFIKREPAK